MEVWQVGMFLGPDGDPVIRGARQLTTKSDRGSEPAKPGSDPTLAARIARQKRLQQEAGAT